MQLTSFTDYALRTLIYLASLPKDELTNITEVTDLFGVSRNHMVKVINRLGQLGYVHTVRGKNGGIRLMKAPQEITVVNPLSITCLKMYSSFLTLFPETTEPVKSSLFKKICFESLELNIYQQK